MKIRYKFILLFFVCSISIFSQESDSLKLIHKNGITKHNVLSTHPFGIFISRVQGNFKKQTSGKTNFKISLESGNVWGTPIKTYVPIDEDVRNLARNYKWHQAQYYFEEETLNAQTYELQIDGVIKSVRANIDIKLAANHELNLGFRSYLLTKGKYAFSPFTSDDFIEFFHKNIGGGDDPFDRGVFGLNKASIKYILFLEVLKQATIIIQKSSQIKRKIYILTLELTWEQIYLNIIVQ